MTMRCGWNAVAEMGEPRFCPRKLEYGSERESSLPWKLNTLTMWAEVPLQVDISVLHIHMRVRYVPEAGYKATEGMISDLHREDWQMLMDTRRPQDIFCRLEHLQRLVLANVPQPDLSIPRS